MYLLSSGLQFKIIEVNRPSQNEYDEEVKTLGYGKLFKNPKILVATGAICISTSAMALLEPCLPIWLMDTIHPEVIKLEIFEEIKVQLELFTFRNGNLEQYFCLIALVT